MNEMNIYLPVNSEYDDAYQEKERLAQGPPMSPYTRDFCGEREHDVVYQNREAGD